MLGLGDIVLPGRLPIHWPFFSSRRSSQLMPCLRCLPYRALLSGCSSLTLPGLLHCPAAGVLIALLLRFDQS